MLTSIQCKNDLLTIMGLKKQKVLNKRYLIYLEQFTLKKNIKQKPFVSEIIKLKASLSKLLP